MKNILEHPNVLVRVDGLLYTKEMSPSALQMGDLVLDKKDLTYATIEGQLPNGNFILKDGCVSELDVPLSRLIKLNLFKLEVK